MVLTIRGLKIERMMSQINAKEIWKETTVQFNGVEVGKESCIFREDIFNN